MKKLISAAVAVVIIAAFSMSASAQCVPLAPDTAGLTPDWQGLTCVNNDGSAYSDTIYVENFQAIPVGPSQVNVDSLVVHNITGLPNGLSYEFNNGQQTIKLGPGETGCVRLFGTTTCPAGRYEIGIYVTVYTNLIDLGPEEGCVLYAQAGQTGPCPFKYYVNVKAPAAACDTNATIVTGCTTNSSRELETVKNITVKPNPFNNNTQLSFYAEEAGVYELKMHDLAGKIVRNEQLIVVNGINVQTITRNNLSEGVYFLMLSKDGKTVTQKVTIAK